MEQADMAYKEAWDRKRQLRRARGFRPRYPSPPRSRSGPRGRGFRRANAAEAEEEEEEEDLEAETGAEKVIKHLEKTFEDLIVGQLEQAFDDVIYDSKNTRQKNETFLPYTARNHAAIKHLEKQGIELPSKANALILLHDAKVSEKARETLTTWQRGVF